MVIRAAFTWLSKVICIYFGFALQHSVIGKKLVPLSQPIRSKTKTNRKYNQNQSRLAHASFPTFRVIASSFDWTMDCSASFVIGQSNYFGFGSTTLIWKLLYGKKRGAKNN